MGLDYQVEEPDFKKLTYLRCALKQTLCLHPLIPCGLDRRSCLGMRGGGMRSSWRCLISVDATTSDNGISDGLAGDDTAWLIPNLNSLGSFAKNNFDQELVARSGGGTKIQGWQWRVQLLLLLLLLVAAVGHG